MVCWEADKYKDKKAQREQRQEGRTSIAWLKKYDVYHWGSRWQIIVLIRIPAGQGEKRLKRARHRERQRWRIFTLWWSAFWKLSLNPTSGNQNWGGLKIMQHQNLFGTKNLYCKLNWIECRKYIYHTAVSWSSSGKLLKLSIFHQMKNARPQTTL